MPIKPQPRSRIAGLYVIVALFAQLLFTARQAHSAAALQSGLPPSMQEQIDTYLQAHMRAAHIPGLALGVVRGDQVVYLRGYGVAGPDGRPVTVQTPFILGSTSKSFTALAVMQLVEAGLIDLDAPVIHYLPWFRTADTAASARITVRQLLNQTSGLPVEAGRRGFADDNRRPEALETGVRQLTAVALNHPPGQAYEYANENYTVLGQIIQAVSDRSYEEVIQSQIFAPLEMNHSAAALDDASVREVASGHRYWFGQPAAFDAPYPRAMTPAGFLIASAEDVTHYLIAQLNAGVYRGRPVVSAAGLAALHAPGAQINASSWYGMGWVVHPQAGALQIEHNGDTSNFHSNLLLLPDQRTGLVILMNVNGFGRGAALNLPIEGVAAILQGHGPSPEGDPPIDWLTLALLPLPLFVAALWLAGSTALTRRWQRRGEVPVRGWRIIWRFGLPLAVDLGLAGAGWIVLPTRFQTPIATIGLFAPDVMAILVLLTVLGLVGALRRVLLVFPQPRSGAAVRLDFGAGKGQAAGSDPA